MMQQSQREQIQKELEDACQHVSDLQNRLETLILTEQHGAIDELDQHFDAVETRFKGLRIFLKTVFESSKSQ
ncbi:MAG: hypothetical protein ACSHX7_05225 [Luteolibacter sp.]